MRTFCCCILYLSFLFRLRLAPLALCLPVPLRSRYPRARPTFSGLVGAGGPCCGTSLATGFQPSNLHKNRARGYTVTASSLTQRSRRDGIDSPVSQPSSCEDCRVLYQKMRLSRKGVNCKISTPAEQPGAETFFDAITIPCPVRQNSSE